MPLPACLLFVCLLEAPSGNPTAAITPALRLWEQGQQAMLDGQIDRALACYQQSLELDPKLARCCLSMAAAYLEKGQEKKAAGWMARYLEQQPDHHMVRSHYAELLLRLNQPGQARQQLERFIADIQDEAELADQHLVRSHSRLMEIATQEQDEYAEHLHRGIGLFVLGCQRAELAGEAGELSAEGLLCQAAGELTLARLQCPEEARASWYLFQTWKHLAQQQPALKALRQAEEAAPFSYLTPTEQRDLQLAWRQRQSERGGK
jgi:tetratricopeptide (TPR) repeat protein